MIELLTTAHVDEAGARLPDGRRLYVMAAVLSSPTEQPTLVDALTSLQIHPTEPLHFRVERPNRRVLVAEAIAAAPVHGAILLTTSTTNTGQEAARRALLCTLLPRLEHVESVRQVVIESRAGGDRHDVRTRNWLRQSRRITAALRIDHEPKSSPLLWPADWIASAYVAAHHHDEREPWEIINNGHLIDITVVDNPRWREAGGPDSIGHVPRLTSDPSTDTIGSRSSVAGTAGPHHMPQPRGPCYAGRWWSASPRSNPRTGMTGRNCRGHGSCWETRHGPAEEETAMTRPVNDETR